MRRDHRNPHRAAAHRSGPAPLRMFAPLFLVALALLPGSASLAGPAGRVYDFARLLDLSLGLQGRAMWIDATANLDRTTTLEGVRDIVERCRAANFNMLIVDVKPISGQVVYASKLAPRLRQWKGRTYPDFDVLRAFVDEGHRAGLEVYASLNVLTEGHKLFGVGLAYQKPDWQSVTYMVDRSLVAADGARLPVRGSGEPVDPGRPLVQGDDDLIQPGSRPGEAAAVVLDDRQHVTGIVDPALLGNEPLGAPEGGSLLEVRGSGLDWVSRHLPVGSRARFDAVGRRVPIVDAPTERVAAFVNPLNADVRRYELSLLDEVARNYAIDGVVFDRLRYANLYNDYSDLSRSAFERWLGRRVENWPGDVIRFDPVPNRPMKRGPLFGAWLEFRARVIRQFAKEAADAVRAARSTADVASYTGSWFAEYYGVGVNWGSEKFEVRTPWATERYNEAGYAEFLDWLTTGCYYGFPTRSDARAARQPRAGTVEAAAELSSLVVANSVPVYAGVYALDYQGRPDQFVRAIETAARTSHGVMVFDISQIYDYGWWPAIQGVFAGPAIPPHRVAGLAALLRAAHDAVRAGQDARAAAANLPAVPALPGGG